MFSPQSNAECVGCGVDLLIFPAIFATTGLATSYVPELFIEEGYEYDYSSTYWTGLGMSTATMLATALILDNNSDLKYSDRVDYHLMSGLTGLLIGNVIGYYSTKHEKLDNFSIQVDFDKDVSQLNLTYRF